MGGNRPLMQLRLAPTCACSKKGPKGINAPGRLGPDQQEPLMVEKGVRRRSGLWPGDQNLRSSAVVSQCEACHTWAHIHTSPQKMPEPTRCDCNLRKSFPIRVGLARRMRHGSREAGSEHRPRRWKYVICMCRESDRGSMISALELRSPGRHRLRPWAWARRALFYWTPIPCS